MGESSSSHARLDQGAQTYWIPTYLRSAVFQHLHCMIYISLSLYIHFTSSNSHVVEVNLELISCCLFECFEKISKAFSTSGLKFSLIRIVPSSELFLSDYLVWPQVRLPTLTPADGQNRGSSQGMLYTNLLMLWWHVQGTCPLDVPPVEGTLIGCGWGWRPQWRLSFTLQQKLKSPALQHARH